MKQLIYKIKESDVLRVHFFQRGLSLINDIMRQVNESDRIPQTGLMQEWKKKGSPVPKDECPYEEKPPGNAPALTSPACRIARGNQQENER